MCEHLLGKERGSLLKKKVKRALENLASRSRNDRKDQRDQFDAAHNLKGRRVVELQTLANELWCNECDQTLSLRNVKEEIKRGFASILKVVCLKCANISIVKTNKLNKEKRNYDVNLKAAIAVIDSGIGETQLNTICSAINIPSISPNLLKRHERVVGPAIESVAKESCRESIKKEKELSKGYNYKENKEYDNTEIAGDENNSVVLNHDVDQNNPSTSNSEHHLIASFDAGWQKRGTGHAYNSLSGHSSLIGYHTGKVLSYSTRSKKCRKCAAGRKKEDHDCRQNFSGSAKAMEPDMAVELVNRNEMLKDENANISVLIGDDDSCTIAAVRREASEPIEKWSDFNHAHKAFKNALYSLKLQLKLIEYFSNCFSCAVKQNKGSPKNVETALQNVVPHAFGNHSNCGEWCKHKSTEDQSAHTNLPNGKPLSDPELRVSLSKLFARFANNASKLAPCASSQANESFNSVVASKHPKSRHYAGSESLDTRVSAAVGQKNIATKYVMQVNDLICLSPGKETLRYREWKDNKRKKQAVLRKSIESKRKRLFAKKEKSAKTAAVTKREGITYKTEIGLANVSDLLQNPSICENVSFDNCRMVIFDLETTGLRKTAEICQIAACTDDSSYNSYIIPSKGMSPGASQITGIKVIDGEMYLNDTKLHTVPVKTAFTKFLQFLESQGQSLILVAHNAFRFDAPRIVKLASDLGLIGEFMSVVQGFADTLHIFREKLPDRRQNKQKFSQEALAADFLDTADLHQAHNAINDVQTLHELIIKVGIDRALITKHTRSVLNVLKSEDAAKASACIKASLGSLTEISAGMKTKMSKAGIDLSILKKAFASGGYEGVNMLLAEDVGGRPRVTKCKKILEKIVKHLNDG